MYQIFVSPDGLFQLTSRSVEPRTAVEKYSKVFCYLKRKKLFKRKDTKFGWETILAQRNN